MRRSLYVLLAVCVLGYAGICAWMYAQQRTLMYYPQFTRTEVRQADFDIDRDGIKLRGWMVNAGQPGAILYFGGNAERVEAMRDEFAQWFPDSSVYLLPYRGYGASEGTPSQSALFGDALALYDHVQARQHGAPIMVIGRSLGSGVASYVASRRPVAKLVLVTPFDSMVDVAQAHYRWLPVRWLIKDRYPSTRYLARYTGPILIIRAGDDAVVPAANTDRLIASLPKPPRIVEIADADHNSIGANPAYRKALTTFLATPPPR